MSASELPPEFREQLNHVTGRRSRIVVEHILEHGFITTDDLEQIYGYMHPPRAVRDVREQGIPIETYRIRSPDGRNIAAYRFGNPEEVREGQSGGRITFPRKFKLALFDQQDGKCAICNGLFANRELQIDHRIPYEIAGDVNYSEDDTTAYLLLCGSCNRAKSWSCEHCPNWQGKKEIVCRECYWAQPTSYIHVATREVRRADLIWEGEDEMRTYSHIAASSTQAKQSIPDYIKGLLKDIITSVVRLFV
ncbi:MAG: hypothetical protein OXG26_10395 [Caldilineaceae bacterium]|nr:hypothetical protein [Caldilineaceae bacterium]